LRPRLPNSQRRGVGGRPPRHPVAERVRTARALSHARAKSATLHFATRPVEGMQVSGNASGGAHPGGPIPAAAARWRARRASR
jgi:hypothetical protein